MQYAALNEKGRWVRCPICFECVLLNEIRAVHLQSVSHIRTDDVVTFELLCRNKSHTIVTPKWANTAVPLTNFPFANSANSKYSRFMISSVAFRQWAFQQDRMALDKAIWEAKSEQSEALPFLLEASRLIETKREELSVTIDSLSLSLSQPPDGFSLSERKERETET